MCMLIAKFSSQAHELVLPFLVGAAVGSWWGCPRCSLNRSRLSAPWTPASCRRARAKARLRSASARHAVVGCRCAPRPGAVPLGSGATNQDPDCDPSWSSASVPATIRSNSRLVVRSRHPMQVRMGPSVRVEMSSCGTTGQHSTGVAPLIRNGNADRVQRGVGRGQHRRRHRARRCPRGRRTLSLARPVPGLLGPAARRTRHADRRCQGEEGAIRALTPVGGPLQRVCI
jgi:hypothetical protein